MTDPNTQLALQVRHDLQRMATEFESVLPPQIPAERFVRTAITAVQQDPDLLCTDRRSLLGSCMKAAQDGLLLDKREAALVIYKGKAQYLPMVAGILKKVRQSGQISTIAAHVVYERDEFDYQLGDDERIFHKPNILQDRGKPVAVYCIARTVDGGAFREVMSTAQVEKIRARAPGGQKGPWVTDWDEMARKTVVRRLSKYLPSSTDLDQVLQRDNEADGGPVQAVTVGEAAPQLEPADTIADLNRQIAAQSSAPASAPAPVVAPAAAVVDAEVMTEPDPQPRRRRAASAAVTPPEDGSHETVQPEPVEQTEAYAPEDPFGGEL
jgi:phage RecT family recombinase